MNVYLSRDGSVEGPYDLAELSEQLASGALNGTEQVCPEGRETWISLADAVERKATPARPRREQNIPDALPRKRSGCRRGCLFILIAFGVLCLVLAITVNRIVWHSAIPYKFVANLVCKDNPDLRIEGITGSISEGVSIRHFSYTDEEGNTSFLENAGFRHNPLRQIFTKQRFILYTLEAERGHFFVSSFTGDKDADENDATDEDFQTEAEEAGDGLDLFEIRSISIENIVIEARDTGKAFELARLHLDGFKIEDDRLDMGELIIESNLLELEVPPASSAFSNGQAVKLDMNFKGRLRPDLIEALAKAIPFEGTLTMEDGTTSRADLAACGEAVTASMHENADGHGQVTLQARDWRIGTYAPRIMLDHVSGILTIEMLTDADTVKSPDGKDKKDQTDWTETLVRLTVADGSFKLGTAVFTCEALDKRIDPTEKEPIRLAATAVKDTVSYKLTAALTLDPATDDADLQLSLTSTPESSLRDCLGKLLFEQPYAELPAENQKQIEWHEKAFLTPLFDEAPDKPEQDDAHPEGGR